MSRINGMHHAYDIHPDDFVAVGCDVPLMSLEIADRFGWRPVIDAERESLRLYYSKETRAFGSHQSLPVAMRRLSQQPEGSSEAEGRAAND
jgi:hypothetical protein